MKAIYKWTLLGVAMIVLAALVAVGIGYSILASEVAQTSGVVQLDGLENPVEAVIDKWGVPHIMGSSDADLVRVLGYMHASERLWQLDLVRRAAEGRLSEIFGEITYDTDVFQRVIGLDRFAKKAVKELDPDTLALFQAYCDGVNAYINAHPDNPAIEFRLLGYKMEPWRPRDIVALGRMTGWQLSGDWRVETLRYALIKEYGPDRGAALLPLHSDPGPYIIPPEEKKYGGQGASIKSVDSIKTADLERSIKFPALTDEQLTGLLALDSRVRDKLRVFSPDGFASNSWVVSPSKTASGGAILCNDPHLETLLPSVWYESHLMGKDINVAGVTFPGTPVIVLGHTLKAAWGATTTEADTQDLYLLNVSKDGKEYLYDGKWLPFEIAEEKIRVRKKGGGFEVRTLEVRLSRHGPVITDALPGLPKDLPQLALRWTGYEKSNEFKAIWQMARAGSWEQFLQALDGVKVPAQNWVYADAKGDIGYIANGYIPIRPKTDGFLPTPGYDSSFDWTGFIPQDQLPQLANPARGYIATANNKVVPEEDYPYTISHLYAPPYRAMRINEVLKSGYRVNFDDMAELQMDNKMMLGERMTPYFIKAYEKKADKNDRNLKIMVNSLRKWDYHATVDSAATTFFLESYRQAFRLTYEDEMSEELFGHFREQTAAFNGFDNGIEEDFAIFDDIRTKTAETRDDILLEAMEEAIKVLQSELGPDMGEWEWGKLHTITFNHPLARGLDVIRRVFSVGPFPVNGSRDTVNNTHFRWFTNPYKVRVGPSMRHIVDFGDMESSGIAITVGQSQHRLSRHYSDQVNDWLHGGHHPMPLTREGVDRIAESSIAFIPKK